ncbi:MAG TPA: Ig-like domain-containing protein [Gemmatimonadales bacterium]
MNTGRYRLLAATAALAIGACSSDGTGAGDVLVVSQVEIDPPGAGLVVGATQQLTATPKTASGITVPNREVSWSSDDPNIATVSASGLVTGVSLGETSINARVDQVTESVPVNVSPKPVAQVVVEPTSATIQVAQSRQLTATVKAADGETLTGRTVEFESDDPTIATVSTSGLVTGVAAGQTTVRAISEGKEAAASISVTPRPAARLAFTTQPTNGIAGNSLAAIRVAVQDEIGGTVPNATNAVSIALDENPGNATLTGTLTVEAVAGVATFSNLEINRPATGYRLRATAGALAPAVSTTFAIVSGPPASMVITTQPSATAASGAPFAQQPVVQLRDREGNNAAQPGVAVTAALVGSGGTLAGTLTVATDAGGAARFTNLRISGGAGEYQLQFTAPALPAVTSSTITVMPSALEITTQPSASASSGTPLTQQPAVRLVDAGGDPVAQSGVVITVALSGSGGTLSGATSATTTGSGVATFSGLTITGTPGTYRLVFSSNGLASVTSSPIELGAGAAAELRIAVEPSSQAVSGLPFLIQPQVQLVDQNGTPVSTSGVTITASLASGSGTLGGTLTAPTNASGRAEFSDLRITGSGEHTIRFSADGLTSVVSNPINVVLPAAAALELLTQPSTTAVSGEGLGTQPQVRLLDDNGDPVSTDGVVITATIASAPGEGAGLTNDQATTSATGVAAFSGLTITGPAGDYTLRFTSGSLTPVVSEIITLTVPSPGPTQLIIVQQPDDQAVSGQELDPQPTIRVDNAGAGMPGVDVLASVSTGGTLQGGTTKTSGSNGQAVFTNLRIKAAPGVYILTFSAPALPAIAPVSSLPITISANVSPAPSP